jgi:23S rRNA A1618 N6-methylase RlmF
MTLLEDISRLEASLKEVSAITEATRDSVKKHEEQISGERGLSAAINNLTTEVRQLRKAAYWVAGLIVASSVGFAFSVLQLVH